MATGGTPLTRVFLVLALLAYPATLITLEQPVLAQDGDAVSKLKEGLELLRSGDPEKVEQAIKILRQALAAMPGNEDVLAALNQAEWRSLINLVAHPEGRKVAVDVVFSRISVSLCWISGWSTTVRCWLTARAPSVSGSSRRGSPRRRMRGPLPRYSSPGNRPRSSHAHGRVRDTRGSGWC